MKSVQVVFALILLTTCASQAAIANPLDTDGYIKNWTGTVIAEFDDAPFPQQLQPTVSLSQTITESVSPKTLCAMIKDGLGMAASKASLISCAPGALEVRGKMLLENQLGLKLIMAGSALAFQISGVAGDNPKIDVTTDVEADATIVNADCVDGSVAQGQMPSAVCRPGTPSANVPLSGLSLMVGFSNTKVTSKNVALPLLGIDLNAVADKINGYTVQSEPDLVKQVSASLAQENSTLQSSAQGLSLLIRAGSMEIPGNTAGCLSQPPTPGCDANASAYLSLVMIVDQNQRLAINFRRNGVSAPVPNNCFGSSLSYGMVTVDCYSYGDGALVYDHNDPMSLWRQDPGGLIEVDDGASNEWDVRPPRFAVPSFEDSSFQVYAAGTGPASATYQVQATNMWSAPVLSPPFSVTIDYQVTPIIPAGPPLCGPGSQPYRPCLAFKAPVGKPR